MIEIDKNTRTKTIVICPVLSVGKDSASSESRINEIISLACAIDVEIVYSDILTLKDIKPATYFSKGFVKKMLPVIEETHAFLMVVDATLTPIQQRNLEKELKIKVIDRTALILEIFGERAQTNEGKLQVELAHLTYQRSRLVRSWTHLERQRGGAGFLGGPGEKQIELDKRVIDDKIIKINKELEKVKNTRLLQRANRKKVPYPIVALVGYTNAGKSSLFNKLTQDHVMVADMLFATLDPVLRKVCLKNGFEFIISDTVGFISNLPHELVMAFRATLEEVKEADVIVHVRDIANPDTDVQRKDVLDVLSHLGLKDIEKQDNYIEVYNKADLLSLEEKAFLVKKNAKKSDKIVMASALTGEGCDKLLDLVQNKLTLNFRHFFVTLPSSDGKALSLVYKYANVINTTEKDDQICLLFECDAKNVERLVLLLPEKYVIKKG